MSLAEREQAAVPGNRGHKVCDVAKALAGLDQTDADALHRLIYNRRDLSSREVTEIVAEEGIEIAAHTIGRHRRGMCRSCRKG